MPSRTKPPRDNAVRVHRLLAELTQAELAERVEVSRQTIVAVESGGYAPSVYLALALAQQLGTTVETLFATTAANPQALAPQTGATRDR
ncbi:MAG: helix-turn-helix transcriptional regulator [Intrasporangiaceae bacterium]|nr:helix-turn-helix transcriptional regulator [Intrasporangiaceae bacterium]